MRRRFLVIAGIALALVAVAASLLPTLIEDRHSILYEETPDRFRAGLGLWEYRHPLRFTSKSRHFLEDEELGPVFSWWGHRKIDYVARTRAQSQWAIWLYYRFEDGGDLHAGVIDGRWVQLPIGEGRDNDPSIGEYLGRLDDR